jgi:hypothetical protein
MSTQKLQVVTPPTALTSTGTLENSGVTLAGTFDNSTILAPVVDIGIMIVPVTTPSPGQIISIYMVPWVNSTNQTSVDTTTPVLPYGTLVGSARVTDASTSPLYMCIQGIQLSALKYDVYIQNLDVTFISSWSITFNPTDWQY